MASGTAAEMLLLVGDNLDASSEAAFAKLCGHANPGIKQQAIQYRP